MNFLELLMKESSIIMTIKFTKLQQWLGKNLATQWKCNLLNTPESEQLLLLAGTPCNFQNTSKIKSISFLLTNTVSSPICPHTSLTHHLFTLASVRIQFKTVRATFGNTSERARCVATLIRSTAIVCSNLTLIIIYKRTYKYIKLMLRSSIANCVLQWSFLHQLVELLSLFLRSKERESKLII